MITVNKGYIENTITVSKGGCVDMIFKIEPCENKSQTIDFIQYPNITLNGNPNLEARVSALENEYVSTINTNW